MLYSTRAVVDLAAIHHNLLECRRLAAGRAVLVALKANAYGHGAVEVARMVQQTGSADAFGIATVPEAVELREAGIELPLVKLSQCFADELPAAIEHDVTLCVVDERTIDEAQTAAATLGRSAPVHLKVDTGMGRIGCRPEDAVALARRVADSRNLHLQGIFTHMPISDMADGMDYTRDELARFRACVAEVTAAVGTLEFVHATASGGLLQHELDGMTMVRPGIMVYGYLPDASTRPSAKLRPALSLLTRISFVKHVLAGETVGYGRTWTAPVDTWVATLPVGYADGWNRALSNRGHVLIDGRSYPMVGRVCMDQCMVDLGPGEEPAARVGDEVVLIGHSGDLCVTADDIAELVGTISYEVTCLLTPRVTRSYLPVQTRPV